MADTRWLFWIAVAAFLWLMVSHLTEIETATLPLIRGQPEWILLAAVLQVLYYAVFAAIFKSAFYTVDIKARIRDILPVTLGALFINVVAPTWGMAGAALYVDDASHRGESPARAAAGTLLAQTADFSAFALILAGSIAYLSMQNRLQNYEIAGTAVLVVILCSLAFTLILGLWRPILLMKLLVLAQSGINRLAKKVHRNTVLPDGWAARNAADFSSAAGAIEAHPERLALTLGLALVAHLINIISLYCLISGFSSADRVRASGVGLCHGHSLLEHLSRAPGDRSGGRGHGPGIHISGNSRIHSRTHRTCLSGVELLAAHAARLYPAQAGEDP